MDQIRDEVAEAYARSHARFAQIVEDEEAVRSSIQGFAPRPGADPGRPCPRTRRSSPGRSRCIDSLKLLAEAKNDYLDAIVDYNQAHFELYVATGQPPAAALAQPVPVDGTPPGAGTPPIHRPTRDRRPARLRRVAPPPPPRRGAAPLRRNPGDRADALSGWRCRPGAVGADRGQSERYWRRS